MPLILWNTIKAELKGTRSRRKAQKSESTCGKTMYYVYCVDNIKNITIDQIKCKVCDIIRTDCTAKFENFVSVVMIFNMKSVLENYNML